MRARWQDPEYRAKALKHLNESRAMQTEETRRKISETMKRVWEQVGEARRGEARRGWWCLPFEPFGGGVCVMGILTGP